MMGGPSGGSSVPPPLLAARVFCSQHLPKKPAVDPQKFMSVSNVWVHVNLCMLKMHIHPSLSCHVYAELTWEKGRSAFWRRCSCHP